MAFRTTAELLCLATFTPTAAPTETAVEPGAVCKEETPGVNSALTAMTVPAANVAGSFATYFPAAFFVAVWTVVEVPLVSSSFTLPFFTL